MPAPDLTSRGFRLNNPLCLSWREKDKWQGLSDPDHDNPPRGMTKLCIFDDPVMGIRAGVKNLIAGQDKYGCTTIADHITRHAPPREKAPADKNDTKAYIKFVSQKTGFPATMELDLHTYEHLRPLTEAIIDRENRGDGHPYTDTQIDKALVLAGIQPPEKPLAATGTMRGVQASSIGVGGIGLSAIADQVSEYSEPVSAITYAAKNLLLTIKPFAPYLLWVGLPMVMLGLGYIAYRRYQDRRLRLR